MSENEITMADSTSCAMHCANEQQGGSVTAEQVPDNNDEKKWNHVFADDDAAHIAAAAIGSETITASTASGATGVNAPHVEPIGSRRSCERRHQVLRRADRLSGTPPTRLQVRMCNRISTHNILSMNRL